MIMSKTGVNQLILQGISGSPGICIGKAYIIDREGVDVIKRYSIPESMLTNEVNRFKDAVEKAKQEYAQIIDSLDEDLGTELNILESHMLLFKDKMLYEKSIQTIIDNKINAEWALRNTTRQIKLIFREVEDLYLKARGNDIEQVSEKIISYLVGVHDEKISDINKRVILVAHDISPADTSQIQLERIMGFITDRGGKDSHTSIIAKSLKIPTVVGLGTATINIKNDDLLIVDGSTGVIVINPDEDVLLSYEEKRERFERNRALLARDSHLPAVTKDGVAFNLSSNIELIEDVVAARDSGATGIGLFRTEFLYLDLKRFPTEEELFIKYKELAELMNPQPVTIRTLDINGDKVNPIFKGIEEENPALGLRAIRYCLQNSNIFVTQLKAILRAATFGNVSLLIPMISTVHELLTVKKILKDVILDLEKKGETFKKDISLGIMIEVPSAVMMAEELGEHVDFFSIGTNDLIQYTLAIDRKNRQVAHLFQPLNPAVLKMLKLTIDAAAKKDVNVVMCGEMAGDPINIPLLMEMGIKDFSMSSASIPIIKQLIRNLDSKQTKGLYEKALKYENTAAIVDMIKNKFKDISPFKEEDLI
ncbi:MAG: phosphoenolpyruvate--protein phosphotransferase [Desulfobacterales bacterium]|nr:phosphoenolpyruvate--protein phosphotransferase [Desulfobacterales bacterium]